MDKWTEWYTNDVNNISFWYPKIKDCGINVPQTFIVQVPENVMKASFLDNHDKDRETILEFIKNKIMPILSDNSMYFFFMKNGTFSNKFDFNDSCKCRAELFEVVEHFMNICYHANCFEAGGISEVAIREYIGDWNYLEQNIPCIYNGMPLRPEFRVFYDFDERKVLYSVNYWDWDYCHEGICKYNATDEIVYEYYYGNIMNEFESRQQKVEMLVYIGMRDVRMTGKWSIDIMWDEQRQEYWLIDMAQAEHSAYWKGNKYESEGRLS